MASVQQCERALQSLADRLAAVDPEQRAKYMVERTVSCHVPDLDVVFAARLGEGGLSDVHRSDDGNAAQVRLAANSDDLLALADGTLRAPSAWATGRLRIDASVLDLLKLRSLL